MWKLIWAWIEPNRNARTVRTDGCRHRILPTAHSWCRDGLAPDAKYNL